MSEWQHRIGDLELLVSHRELGGDGGPSLEIHDRAADRQLLRFDCFDRAPHFHVDPNGRDALTHLDPLGDPIGWTIGELRRDWSGWLEKAGHQGTGEAPDATLAGVEGAMRNPPARLDDLDLEVLHSRRSEKWETYPDDVLPAWVAEMDFPLADPIRRVLQRAVDLSDIGYPISPNKTGLREAFADRMHDRFGWSLDPRRSEILTDVVQGMYLATNAVSGEGDGVAVWTPIYPPFLGAVSDMKRRLIECRAEPADARFEFDIASLRERIDERTRLMLFCNPHNPTGRVFSREELEAVAELALERDLVVFSDEIHGDLVYPGRSHIPFASLAPEVAERTITLTSATKAFNIPGLRCALAHFGSAELQRHFNDSVARRFGGGLGLLGLYATQAAWRHSQPWLDEVLPYLEANRDLVARFVAERLPGVVCFEAEATYLQWLDFRALDLPKSPARFFYDEARVALSDGKYFGPGFDHFARLNFATSRAILTQVLERMAGALEKDGDVG